MNHRGKSTIYISGCTINIGRIDLGGININIGNTPSRNDDYRQERISNREYTNEEIEARMKFFKANSP